MGDFSTECVGDTSFVVGVELGVVSPARHGDVRETPVDERLALVGVHVHEDAVGSLTLAAVTGHGIAVIEMNGAVEREGESPTCVEPEVEAAALDVLNCSDLAIRNVSLPVWCGGLHAVPTPERPVGLAVDGDALQPSRVVGEGLAIRLSHSEEILPGMDLFDLGIRPGGQAIGSAAGAVADDITWCVLRRPLPVGVGDLLPRDQHANFVLLVVHDSSGPDRLMGSAD